MKKSRFKKPYKKSGATNFPHTRKKSGVYIIKRNNKTVYVGHSKTNIYKTMYRHFQEWSDPSQTRVSYASQRNNKRYKFAVRIVLTTPARAPKLEEALILKLKPKNNPEKIKAAQLSKRQLKLFENQADDYFGKEIATAPF